VGVLTTATLLGSALLTLAVGFYGSRAGVKTLLLTTSLLMLATGIGFAAVTEFWQLPLIAFVRTLNPSAGDVSVFLPREQTAWSGAIPIVTRTDLFARYNLVGSLLGAGGVLLAIVPDYVTGLPGVDRIAAFQTAFVDLGLAVALLLVRSLLSQMDVPTRTSYVMAVVTPAERPAAASVTAVPRSLASALGPTLGGLLLAASPFAWPLFLGGALKAAYDLTLLLMFQHVKPPEEQRFTAD
jgi:hypothetical protein